MKVCYCCDFHDPWSSTYPHVRGVFTPKLRLFTALLTRISGWSKGGTLGRGGRLGTASAPALQTLEQRAGQEAASIFGLVLRYASQGELECAPGALVIDAILPDSAAARSGMLQIGDRVLGVDREPVGWLTTDELQLFTRAFDSLTFELGRLPRQQPEPHPQSCVSVSPDVESGLGTLREESEHAVANVVVSDTAAPTTTTTTATDCDPTVVHSGMGGCPEQEEEEDDDDDDDEEEEEEEDDEEIGSAVRIMQIQLPFVHPPSPGSSPARLGLSIAPSAKGSSASGGQRVVSVDRDSPAHESGLRVGDCILGLEDRLLIACGGHDSTKVLRAIDAAWTSRVATSTAAEPVTLTVIRTTTTTTSRRQKPLRVRTADTAALSGLLPRSTNIFPRFDSTALPPSKPLGLVGRSHLPQPRRLFKDVGDNIDVQLQAAPPGLLTAFGAGELGVVGACGMGADFNGVVDDFNHHYHHQHHAHSSPGNTPLPASVHADDDDDHFPNRYDDDDAGPLIPVAGTENYDYDDDHPLESSGEMMNPEPINFQEHPASVQFANGDSVDSK